MNNIKKQDGSTLIQVLITLVVASIAVIAMSRISMITMGEGTSTAQRMSAIMINQEASDNVRQSVYSGTDELNSTTVVNGTTADFTTVNSVVTTTNAGSTISMRNITSTTTWTDSSGMNNTVQFVNSLPLDHATDVVYSGLLIMQFDGTLI